MNKRISVIISIIMILSIVTSAGFSSSANADAVAYETVSEYPDSIDFFFSGSFYLDGYMTGGKTSTPIRMATGKSQTEITVEMPDSDLDLSIYAKGKDTYLKLSSGSKKHYVELTDILKDEMGLDFSEITELIPSIKYENYSDPVVVSSVYNGNECDVYIFKNYDNVSSTMFYVIEERVVQILITDDKNVASYIVVNELTGRIPSDMLTVRGYTKTSILTIPLLYPEFSVDGGSGSSGGSESSKPVEITTLPLVEIPEETTKEPVSDAPEMEEPTIAEPESEVPSTVKPTEKPTDAPITEVIPDEPVVLGDVDSDGYTTSADARLILRASAGLEKLNNLYTPVADVDSDSKITAADARLALRYSALLETDENAAPARTYLDEERNNEVKIKADIPSYSEGNEFTLTVSAKNMFGAENGNIFLTYDPSVFEFVNAEKNDNSECELVFADEYEDGKISIAFVYKESAMTDSAFADITFKALTKAETQIKYVVGTWNGTYAPEDSSFSLVAYEEFTTEPATKVPETEVPTTEPTTMEPETEVPTTEPTTKEPETEVPTTEPTTKEPETEPTTKEPVTQAPTTEKPTEKSTEAPTQKPVSDKLEVKDDTVRVDNTSKVSAVNVNSSANDILKSVKNENVSIIDKDGKAVSGDALVGTGAKIQIKDNSGKVISTYTVCVPTDVDGNGKTTAADARLTLRGSAKLDKVEGVYASASDMNGDGKITAADARKILRISAGLEKA